MILLVFILLSSLCVSLTAHENSPNKEDHILTLTMAKDMNDGSLASSFLEKIAAIFAIDFFVETGTYLGNSALRAAAIFKEVHTIELSKELAERAKILLKDINNINVYFGDSAKVLYTILPHLKDKGKTLFWLDGHYSGAPQGYETAKNEKNPLLDELQCIKESQIVDAVILIDDIRLCDSIVQNSDDPTVGGYPTLSEIRKAILTINESFQFIVLGDILIAYLSNPAITISPLLQACTFTRLIEDSQKDLGLIIEAEKDIVYATTSEREVLQVMSNNVLHDPYAQLYGIGRHYQLWRAIILIHDKNYSEALKLLLKIYEYDLDREHINFYLDQIKQYLI